MVASGKGGVGKSTVAVNVAVALSRQGRRVGLLDADVYGPSAPTLLGCPQARPDADAEGKPIAIEAHGIHALSTGFLTDDDRAFALRGPMATRALARIGEMGGWPEALDVLIVDAPPGTGDIHLSMVQRLSVDGAVVVSTPNTLALADVRRAISFLHAARIPVLGLVENMSVVEDPKTGARVDIYGEGGLNRLAQAAGVPVLAAIPQTPDLRLSCDSGVPAAANAQTYEAQHFELLADQIVEAVSRPGATATPPRIVVEDAA
jgi:ATP-binding protein involved in chromosome partitioning